MKLISTIYPTSEDENVHFFIRHPTSIYQDDNGQFLIATKYETFPQKKLFSICESYFTPLSYILKIADVIQMPHKEIKKVHFIQNYIPFNLVQKNNVKNLFMIKIGVFVQLFFNMAQMNNVKNLYRIMMNVFVFLLLNTVQMNNVNILSG